MPLFVQSVAARLAANAVRRDAARRSTPSFATMRHTPISAAVLLSLFVAAAQAGQPATPAAMMAYANQLLDAQKIAADGPGVTVLVARGDQLLYKGARGMASIELGVPMSSEDSQTMVPTLTRFGLLVGERGGVFVADAVATKAIITTPRRRAPPDPPCR